MGIVLYNTLNNRKEPFQPADPTRVGMYVCGMTVYDHCHIGHARVMVVFDAIVRHLRASGYGVTYVRNFTDIDDKIIKRAGELGIPMLELTERHIRHFHEDMDALGVLRADIEPKATEHIPEMQGIIARLMERGLAYASAGDVFYAVERFEGYGKLSGKKSADQEAGARVAVDERKRNPLDFVLWKGAKPGEPQWDSPWGAGRPGWHIECSAMSGKYLGARFDIHGGGRDLIFPHHENEIAQSEGALGHDWVKYWLHNGFVNVINDSGEAEKMSKSLGNFITIRDLLQRYPGEALRLFILNSHYRNPLDFGDTLLEAARAGMERIYTALKGAKERLGELPHARPMNRAETNAPEAQRFFEAMDDDFNTPQALAVLFDLVKRLNQAVSGADMEETRTAATLLRALAANLGLAGGEPEAWFHGGSNGEDSDTQHIEALIAARLVARKTRNFAESDRIRDELAAQGIELQDGKDGTTWRRTR